VSGSAHRQLCSDIVINTWFRNTFASIYTEDLPREFAKDVMISIGEKLNQGLQRMSVAEMVKGKDSCEYHEHKRLNLPRYKTKFEY
jgi:hypothetical protein